MVLEKYKRRVNRLLGDLNSNRRILLCWYGEKGEQLKQEDVLCYVQKIREKYSAQIDFLFIIYENELTAPMTRSIAPGVTWHAFPGERLAQRKVGCLLWDGDQIHPIFNNLSVAHYKKTPFLVARGVFYRVMAATFIWNRAKRHKFLEGKLKNN